jgi:hypothetical protein
MVDHGYRIVAVGKTVLWSKNWLVFEDFLFSRIHRITHEFRRGLRDSDIAISSLS